MNIYPAILTDSLQTAQEQVNIAKKISNIDTVQIDIIDGFFTDNLTIYPIDTVEINFGRLKVDFHLMTEEPLAFAHEIVQYKQYVPIRSVIGQIEKMSSQSDFIEFIKEEELGVGLSLDLFTPLEEILDVDFKHLDVLQLMSIEAGAQGKKFHPRIFDKIKMAKQRARNLNQNLEIVIDGGIKLDHIKKLKNADVDSVGIGSAIWTSDDEEEIIKKLIKDAR